MQPSSTLNPSSNPVALPPGSTLTIAQNPGSPRRGTGQAAPLSPSVHARLETPLRMGNFYTIDSSFKSLSQALKPVAQGDERFAPARFLLELESTIQTGTREAETCYKRQQYDACHLHLKGAKSNQILMLSSIDNTPDEKMPAAIRTALRDSCFALGSTLSEMMIKAKRDADEAKMQKEASRGIGNRGHAISPPPSPVKAANASHVETVSPARGSQKRVQGEAHSPVLALSPPKRQKTETTPDESSAQAATPGASTTTSTATTTVLQSPPSYRPVPQSAIEQTTVHASLFALGTNPDSGAPGSPATKPLPQKKRVLAPQAKPRPPSQLFAAPPDFTGEIQASTTARILATAPLGLKPGLTPGNAVDSSRSDTGNPDQRS